MGKPMYPSLSENNALEILDKQDLSIYSVGISTGGNAEIRMVAANPQRRVIATTIDVNGASFAKEKIESKNYSEQIQVKLEDVSESLPYESFTFDFIYARLVLHYLPKDKLALSLDELYRILKKNGRIFVVVRSANTYAAKLDDATYDPVTGFTTYIGYDKKIYSRFFHTEQSIQEALRSSNFKIESIKNYQEFICSDFERTDLSPFADELIEIVASK
jgi:ubiquinone/menaquinone biosynthesis C-methylase UbiE